ncbi:hypothetical protein ACFL6G_09935 [candidate division KSB1 bacterium]
MDILTSTHFGKNQISAIMKYKTKLEKSTNRNIPLAEAIICWIALGYAEEYRSLYFVHD